MIIFYSAKVLKNFIVYYVKNTHLCFGFLKVPLLPSKNTAFTEQKHHFYRPKAVLLQRIEYQAVTKALLNGCQIASSKSVYTLIYIVLLIACLQHL